MNFLLILFPISIVCFSVKAYVLTWDRNLPWSNIANNTYRVSYEEGICVNFDPEWTNRGKSINTNDKCITLYTKKDCEGESTNFRPLVYDLQFLDTIDFERRAVSFRKCNGSNQQSFEYGKRPQFHFIFHKVSYADKKSSQLFSLRGGECLTLPSEWHTSLSQISLYRAGIKLYSDIDCNGNVLAEYTPDSLLLSMYSVKKPIIKSIRVIDLQFRKQCNSCPKFLYPDSKEYRYWSYLFSIYSSTYKTIFEQRVNRSTNGFISWDFLYASNTSTPTSKSNDKYSYYGDAFQSHFHLLSFLVAGQVGQLGFTRDHIETLYSLAFDVFLERKIQWKNWTHTNVRELLWHSKQFLWRPIGTILNNIEQTWKKEALLRAEIKFPGLPHNVYTISLHADHINMDFVLGNGECKTLPTGLHDQVTEVGSNSNCFVLFAEINCDGPKSWIVYEYEHRTNNDDIRQTGWDDECKSLRICDLTFTNTCVHCPTLLRTSESSEYDFWVFFFLIHSRANRKEFRERVKHSTNGFISWDFLSGSQHTSNQSLAVQYRFAIGRLYFILRSIRADHPGTLGFNTENVEALRGLAARVLADRRREAQQGNSTSWTRADMVTMDQLISIWLKVRNMLDETLANWDPDTASDNICGLVTNDEPSGIPNTVPLIYNGERASYGDDPWHAAIYRRDSEFSDPRLICGATLISSRILVSAAHCFYDERLAKALNDTSDYEISVGKFTRDYRTHDGPHQTNRKIQKLVFHTNGFDPVLTGTYGSDIILIILEKSVQFNSHVRPACLDWDNSVFGSSINDDTMGRLVGWGVTVSGDLYRLSDASKYLMTANLKYISFTECKGKVQHLTTDKFCAGSDKGAGPRSGDSGGGLVFKNEDRFYLRGIVSTRDRYSNSSFATFTNVGSYISWIRTNV